MPKADAVGSALPLPQLCQPYLSKRPSAGPRRPPLLLLLALTVPAEALFHGPHRLGGGGAGADFLRSDFC